MGNYLILYKVDGSLTIHGGDQILARNYQGAGSNLRVEKNHIISTNNNETIIIDVHWIHWCCQLNEWSLRQTKMTRTERELVQKIISHSDQYLGVPLSAIRLEYPTEVGPIDIFTEVQTLNGPSYQVVEVKRKKITLNDCHQLKKYIDHFMTHNKYPTAIIAGPEIGQNALKYCHDNSIEWLEVDFDD